MVERGRKRSRETQQQNSGRSRFCEYCQAPHGGVFVTVPLNHEEAWRKAIERGAGFTFCGARLEKWNDRVGKRNGRVGRSHLVSVDGDGCGYSVDNPSFYVKIGGKIGEAMVVDESLRSGCQRISSPAKKRLRRTSREKERDEIEQRLEANAELLGIKGKVSLEKMIEWLNSQGEEEEVQEKPPPSSPLQINTQKVHNGLRYTQSVRKFTKGAIARGVSQRAIPDLIELVFNCFELKGGECGGESIATPNSETVKRIVKEVVLRVNLRNIDDEFNN
eukprot:CAMPEP_0201514526 /NCGR_PEP_ID=MMETSP0161_2-20130828/6341_1 /ASSEMBLY_ACC=CAM_ASM_000251 /TAXON_ID=180227 /ORGANISM="Neoparamoeba aestuarina, Strain SoJaBio B1-5/56/2" /LENGTH=275 /DNA_ID=CAMNT_0047911109 /DNA_START=165 /DNA_END=992 /DNA_ORIENTATION=+